MLLLRRPTEENRQKRQIYFPQDALVVFGSDEDLITIWYVGFEELRCFVAMGLFMSGSISLDFCYFDRLGWIFGRFSFSVLELDVILVWFGRHDGEYDLLDKCSGTGFFRACISYNPTADIIVSDMAKEIIRRHVDFPSRLIPVTTYR
jgi:hypothetical protein